MAVFRFMSICIQRAEFLHLCSGTTARRVAATAAAESRLGMPVCWEGKFIICKKEDVTGIRGWLTDPCISARVRVSECLSTATPAIVIVAQRLPKSLYILSFLLIPRVYFFSSRSLLRGLYLILHDFYSVHMRCMKIYEYNILHCVDETASAGAASLRRRHRRRHPDTRVRAHVRSSLMQQTIKLNWKLFAWKNFEYQIYARMRYIIFSDV